jgi:RNA polymerase sigma-70 factor (ECF subfamily)
MPENFRGEFIQTENFDTLIKSPELRGKILRFIQSRLRRFGAEKNQDISSLADDLVQQVYLKAIEFRDKFRAESRVDTWLIGIAKNEIRESFRKKKAGARLVGKIELEGDPHVPEVVEPEDHVGHRIALKDTIKEAGKLTPEKQQALADVAMGRTYQEMANKEGEVVGENGLKVRVFRARKELRNELGDKIEEELK